VESQIHKTFLLCIARLLSVFYSMKNYPNPNYILTRIITKILSVLIVTNESIKKKEKFKKKIFFTKNEFNTEPSFYQSISVYWCRVLGFDFFPHFTLKIIKAKTGKSILIKSFIRKIINNEESLCLKKKEQHICYFSLLKGRYIIPFSRGEQKSKKLENKKNLLSFFLSQRISSFEKKEEGNKNYLHTKRVKLLCFFDFFWFFQNFSNLRNHQR